MGVVKKLLSSILLRGRHRIPRFFFLIALTGFVFTIVKLSICNFAPSMCGAYDTDIMKQYGKTLDAFEEKGLVSECWHAESGTCGKKIAILFWWRLVAGAHGNS